jgi:hypothetical protein
MVYFNKFQNIFPFTLEFYCPFLTMVLVVWLTAILYSSRMHNGCTSCALLAYGDSSRSRRCRDDGEVVRGLISALATWSLASISMNEISDRRSSEEKKHRMRGAQCTLVCTQNAVTRPQHSHTTSEFAHHVAETETAVRNATIWTTMTQRR